MTWMALFSAVVGSKRSYPSPIIDDRHHSLIGYPLPKIGTAYVIFRFALVYSK